MGYFDLQVNGYAGVDFNKDSLTAEELRHAVEALRRDGVDAILATIITEQFDRMCRRMTRIAQLRDADPLAQQIIKGIHVEGPFISALPGYVGAHPKDAVIPASSDAARRLVEAGRGLVKLVTLAPEADEKCAATAYFAERGIRVSAGHTNASLDQLKRAMDRGLTFFTHLGNGCPAELPRHDNIIQRVLSLREHLHIMFIADGAHVPFFVLKNFIDLVGTYRCVVVTDAIAPAGLGPGKYTLGRWELQIGDDMVARSPDGSHLVGSAMPMRHAVANLEKNVGLSSPQARKLVDVNPRQMMGLMPEIPV